MKMYMVVQVFKANGYTPTMQLEVLHVSGVKQNCLDWIQQQTYPKNVYAIIEIEVHGE